jgi:hypothetical protein
VDPTPSQFYRIHTLFIITFIESTRLLSSILILSSHLNMDFFQLKFSDKYFVCISHLLSIILIMKIIFMWQRAVLHIACFLLAAAQDTSILIVEAVLLAETSAGFYRTRSCQILEDSPLHRHPKSIISVNFCSKWLNSLIFWIFIISQSVIHMHSLIFWSLYWGQSAFCEVGTRSLNIR